jgi:glycine/D-amino acid oxidase-like deaminating enzyme
MTLKKEASELGNMLDIVEDNDTLAKLRVSNAVGAIVQARAAKLAPYKLVTWLLETLIKRSTLNLQTTTPVTSISSSADRKWSVNTFRGSIETEHILLATNGYTSYLLPQFASLIVPVQGEMSALIPPSFLEDNPLGYSYGFVEESAKNSIQDDYLIQRPKELGGQLMYGGGRALAKNQGVNTDNDDSIDPAAARYLKIMLGHYLHLNDEANSKAKKNHVDDSSKTSALTAVGEWTGIMGFSRDSVPWVGGVPDMEGVWLCGGYTGHGKTSASLENSN